MKKTNLFIAMLLTLGVSFNCNTVEAGMFKQVPDPYGFYTITPECVYNEYTHNDFINSVYLVEVAYNTDDSINVILLDTATTDTDVYTLDKSKDSTYMDYDDNAGYVSLEYFAEYSGWYLDLDGTHTCLEPVTWQYSYIPKIDESSWMNPIGMYNPINSDIGRFFIYDLFNTGYYIASYTRDGIDCQTIVDIEYQEESIIYNIDGLGSIYADDTCYELYPEFGESAMVSLVKDIPFNYETNYIFGAMEIDVPYYLDDGECVKVHLEFDYTKDDYGEQFQYTMDSDFWYEPLTGYAIYTEDSIMISNDFMIFDNGKNQYEIIIPSITSNSKICDWDVDARKVLEVCE